ncbi:MAG: FG-GAP-like repeat-containing protein [Terriglobales bacterium]
MFSKGVALRFVCLAFLLSITSASWGASNFFQPVQAYASGGWRAVSVAMADVNGDGKVDLLVANQCVTDDNCTAENGGIGRGAVGVLLGNGDGTFQAVQAYGSGGYAATSIVAADVNGDGKVDLVVAHHCGDIDCSGRTVVGVLLGNGDGTFQPAVTYGSGGYGNPYGDRGPASIVVGDVNRDGKADIVVANGLVHKDRFESGDAILGVLLGNGDGTFQTAQMYNSGDAWFALSVALGDVNGDGKLDLVVGHADENFHRQSTVGVLLGNGDGTFQRARTQSSGGFVVNDVALSDINGDGKADLLVANLGQRMNRFSRGDVLVQLGKGDGTFADPERIASSWSSSVAIADVNLDGKTDLIVKDAFGVRTHLGDGDGIFHLPGPSGKSPTTGFSIAVADVNGDGRPDVSVALGCTSSYDCTPGVGVLLNAVPYATTTELSSNQNPTVYGQAVTLTATVVPDGPFAPTGTVVFKNGGAGIGNAKVVGGMAALTKTNLPSGSLSITALYQGDINLAKSTSTPLTQVVKMASSNTTIQSSVNPSVQGQPVKFTARVTSPTAKITGTVTFTAGTTTLGTVTLSGGKANITTSALPPGNNTITATYEGTPNIVGSAASLIQIVN